MTYSPTSLWRGRIGQLKVDGWRVDVVLDGGSARIVGIDLPGGSTETKQSFSLDWLRDPPLDAIELGRGCVTLHVADGASIDLPVTGLKFSRGATSAVWRLAGAMSLAGSTVELEGEVRSEGSGADGRYKSELNITSQGFDLAGLPGVSGLANRWPSLTQVRVGRVSVRAAATWAEGQTAPAIETTLTLGDIDAEAPGVLGLAVEGAELVWPLRFGEAAIFDRPLNAVKDDPSVKAQGRVTIPSFTLAGQAWPGLTGVVEQRGLTWTALLSWPLEEESPLAASLTLGVERQPLGVTMELRLPGTPAGQLAVLLGKLTTASAMKELEFQGNVGAAARWRWPGAGSPTVDVTLDNVTIRSIGRDAAMEGLTGSVRVDALAPLSTPGTQRLTFRGGHSGPLAVGEGLVEFRLADASGVFVERVVCGFGRAGRLAAYAFPIAFGQSRFDFELFLESISIQDLLTLMTTTRVRGEGLLYGRLPVSIDLDGARVVQLGQGYIFAQPGEGWLAVSDRQWLDATLGSADASVTGQIQHQAVEALTDYQYARLAFYVQPTEEGLVIRMETSGRGRQGTNPLDIGSLTINIKGADLWLNEWLRPARGSPRAVDHALDRYMP